MRALWTNRASPQLSPSTRLFSVAAVPSARSEPVKVERFLCPRGDAGTPGGERPSRVPARRGHRGDAELAMLPVGARRCEAALGWLESSAGSSAKAVCDYVCMGGVRVCNP